MRASTVGIVLYADEATDTLIALQGNTLIWWSGDFAGDYRATGEHSPRVAVAGMPLFRAVMLARRWFEEIREAV